MEQTIIESMGAYQQQAMQFLSDPEIAKGVNELALTMLLRGIQQGFGGAMYQDR